MAEDTKSVSAQDRLALPESKDDGSVPTKRNRTKEVARDPDEPYPIPGDFAAVRIAETPAEFEAELRRNAEWEKLFVNAAEFQLFCMLPINPKLRLSLIMAMKAAAAKGGGPFTSDDADARAATSSPWFDEDGEEIFPGSRKAKIVIEQ